MFGLQAYLHDSAPSHQSIQYISFEEIHSMMRELNHLGDEIDQLSKTYHTSSLYKKSILDNFIKEHQLMSFHIFGSEHFSNKHASMRRVG